VTSAALVVKRDISHFNRLNLPNVLCNVDLSGKAKN